FRSYADLTNKPVYATVATTGSYNDLLGPPILQAAQGTVADPDAGDPYWNYTSVLLGMDGAVNSTTFTDQKGNAITVSGNAKISATSEKFAYNTTCYLDGVEGTHLSMSNTLAAFGNLDFTIELWINLQTPSTSSYPEIFATSTYNSGGGIYITCQGAGTGWGGTGTLGFSVANGSGVASTTIVRGTGWHHLAFVRYGSIGLLFVDGAIDGQNATMFSGVNLTGTHCYIGATNAGGTSENMYVDDFRITKGVARI